jgi:hypothetical protein
MRFNYFSAHQISSDPVFQDKQVLYLDGAAVLNRTSFTIVFDALWLITISAFRFGIYFSGRGATSCFEIIVTIWSPPLICSRIDVSRF